MSISERANSVLNLPSMIVESLTRPREPPADESADAPPTVDAVAPPGGPDERGRNRRGRGQRGRAAVCDDCRAWGADGCRSCRPPSVPFYNNATPRDCYHNNCGGCDRCRSHPWQPPPEPRAHRRNCRGCEWCMPAANHAQRRRWWRQTIAPAANQPSRAASQSRRMSGASRAPSRDSRPPTRPPSAAARARSASQGRQPSQPPPRARDLRVGDLQASPAAYTIAPQQPRAFWPMLRGWFGAMTPTERVVAGARLIHVVTSMIADVSDLPRRTPQRWRSRSLAHIVTIMCLISLVGADVITCSAGRCEECLGESECTVMEPAVRRAQGVYVGHRYFVDYDVAHSPHDYAQLCRGVGAQRCGALEGDNSVEHYAELFVRPRHRARRAVHECGDCSHRAAASSPAVSVSMAAVARRVADIAIALVAVIGAYAAARWPGVAILLAMLWTRTALAFDDCDSVVALDLRRNAAAYANIGSGSCVAIETLRGPIALRVTRTFAPGPFNFEETIPMHYSVAVVNKAFCPQSTVSCPACSGGVACTTHREDVDMGWTTGCALFAKGTVCATTTLVPADDYVTVWSRATDSMVMNVSIHSQAFDTSVLVALGRVSVATSEGTVSLDCRQLAATRRTSPSFSIYHDARETPAVTEVCGSPATALSAILNAPAAYRVDGPVMHVERAVAWRQCEPDVCHYDANLDYYTAYATWRRQQECYQADVVKHNESETRTLWAPARVDLPAWFACRIDYDAKIISTDDAVCRPGRVIRLRDASRPTYTAFVIHVAAAEDAPDMLVCPMPLPVITECAFTAVAAPPGVFTVVYICSRSVHYIIGNGTASRGITLLASGRLTLWARGIRNKWASLLAAARLSPDSGFRNTLVAAFDGGRTWLAVHVGGTARAVAIGAMTVGGFVLLGPAGAVAGGLLGAAAFALAGQPIVTRRFYVPGTLPGEPTCVEDSDYCTTSAAVAGFCVSAAPKTEARCAVIVADESAAHGVCKPPEVPVVVKTTAGNHLAACAHSCAELCSAACVTAGLCAEQLRQADALDAAKCERDCGMHLDALRERLATCRMDNEKALAAQRNAKRERDAAASDKLLAVRARDDCEAARVAESSHAHDHCDSIWPVCHLTCHACFDDCGLIFPFDGLCIFF